MIPPKAIASPLHKFFEWIIINKGFKKTNSFPIERI